MECCVQNEAISSCVKNILSYLKYINTKLYTFIIYHVHWYDCHQNNRKQAVHELYMT